LSHKIGSIVELAQDVDVIPM